MKLPIYLGASLLLGGCYTGFQGDIDQTGSAGDADGGGVDDGGEDDGGDDGDGGEPVDCSEGPHAGEGDLVRLSNAQYENTVRDLLGVEPSAITNGFTSDLLIGEFAVGDPLKPDVAAQMVRAAENVAAAVNVTGLVPCDPSDGASCAETFIAQFARRAYRHDPSGEELANLRELFDMGDDFDDGIRLVIQATLQSPQVLYLYVPDTADVDPGRTVLLDDFSVASRLSYLLWNTMPDDALLDAASAGELSSLAGLEASFDRMMADPRAEHGVMEFYRRVVDSNRVGSVEKDPAYYPEWNEQLAQALETSLETSLYSMHFGDAPGTLEQMMSELPLFANDDLATFYGWEREPGTGFTPVTDAGRHGRGILSHPAIAALRGKENMADIVGRGVWARTTLLCSPPGDPPPGQNVELDPPPPGVTPREQLEQHRANPGCAGCHTLFDPIGFAMDHYDSDGRFRERYPDGREIDTTGEFTLGSETHAVDGLEQLENVILDDPTFNDCMIDHWLTFAARRVPGAMDECSVDQLRAEVAESGGSLHTLVRATVLGDGFRYVAVPAQ